MDSGLGTRSARTGLDRQLGQQTPCPTAAPSNMAVTAGPNSHVRPVSEGRHHRASGGRRWWCVISSCRLAPSTWHMSTSPLGCIFSAQFLHQKLLVSWDRPCLPGANAPVEKSGSWLLISRYLLMLLRGFTANEVLTPVPSRTPSLPGRPKPLHLLPHLRTCYPTHLLPSHTHLLSPVMYLLPHPAHLLPGTSATPCTCYPPHTHTHTCYPTCKATDIPLISCSSLLPPRRCAEEPGLSLPSAFRLLGPRQLCTVRENPPADKSLCGKLAPALGRAMTPAPGLNSALLPGWCTSRTMVFSIFSKQPQGQ